MSALPEPQSSLHNWREWWTDEGNWTIERHDGSDEIRLTFDGDGDQAIEVSPDGEFYPFTRLDEKKAADLALALLAAVKPK